MNEDGRGKGAREERIKSSILYLEVRRGTVIHHHSISRDADEDVRLEGKRKRGKTEKGYGNLNVKIEISCDRGTWMNNFLCSRLIFWDFESAAVGTRATFCCVLKWAFRSPNAASLVLLGVVKSICPSKRYQGQDLAAGPPPSSPNIMRALPKTHHKVINSSNNLLIFRVLRPAKEPSNPANLGGTGYP